MNLYITGGGTGGHVTPGLAIARYVIEHEPGSIIRFAGTKKGIESRLVPREGYPLDRAVAQDDATRAGAQRKGGVPDGNSGTPGKEAAACGKTGLCAGLRRLCFFPGCKGGAAAGHSNGVVGSQRAAGQGNAAAGGESGSGVDLF